jgi:serine/threonine protein kinase
MGDSEID